MAAKLQPAIGNQRDQSVPMTQQLTLPLDASLTIRHRSLRECVSARIHNEGIVAVAGKLDMSPSHLAEALSGGTGDRKRKFDVDDLERYVEAYKDYTPVHYLNAKFMLNAEQQRSAALSHLALLADQLPAILAAAGLGKKK